MQLLKREEAVLFFVVQERVVRIHMAMRDIISVIIPFYNSEKHLKKCVDSVTSQTYSDLEIILVNDGSYDGSRKIAEKLAKNDGRIRIIDIENSGVSVARNTGLSQSTGSFVMFADSDDMINVNIIQRMMKVMKETKADLVTCQIECTDALVERPISKSILYDIYSKQEYLRLFFKIGTNVQVHYPVAKLYRRELLPEDLYPAGIRIGEDVVGTYKAISQTEKIASLRDVGYYYYDNPDSVTGRFSDKDFDLLAVWDMMVKITEGKEPDHEYALLGRDRINFTLLLRLITRVPADEIRKKYSSLQKRMLKDLRRCEKRLMKAPIVTSRKLMIALLCHMYEPVAAVGDIRLRIRKKLLS